MEHGGREICAQRPADLDRAHRAAARRAAADVVHQFAKRNAEADLIKAAVLYIARKLHRHGAARTPEADGGIGIRPLGKDEGHGREAQHIVDDGRLAEQSLQCGKRRLRSEERRVGKEWGSTVRSRWSPNHKKKKKA